MKLRLCCFPTSLTSEKESPTPGFPVVMEFAEILVGQEEVREVDKFFEGFRNNPQILILPQKPSTKEI